MVPCAGASSDELTTSTSHVAPLKVTLIHSNKNHSQGPPAFSSPRALAASPLLRYLLYPRPFFGPTMPYNISCSRIRSRLWCARRGAPMTNFIPRSHRRSRPPPPFMRARGKCVPVWTQPSERIPTSHHRANTDHDQYAVQVSHHTLRSVLRGLKRQVPIILDKDPIAIAHTARTVGRFRTRPRISSRTVTGWKLDRCVFLWCMGRAHIPYVYGTAAVATTRSER